MNSTTWSLPEHTQVKHQLLRCYLNAWFPILARSQRNGSVVFIDGFAGPGGPYNHPVRTAESVAVLDLLSDGRVEFGTGRSATRAELVGFGIHPNDTRSMWQEALTMTLGAMTNDEFSFDGQYWQMPTRRVLPKPLQDPHPPVWAATSSDGDTDSSVNSGWASYRSRWAHLPKNSVVGSASIAKESKPARNQSESSSTTVRQASRW